MKALDILKADRDYCLAINNDKSIIEQYNEAIKELEDLQNRNCSNCKYTDDEYFDLFCINPDVVNQHNQLFGDGQPMYDNFKVSANFSCNKWEPK